MKLRQLSLFGLLFLASQTVLAETPDAQSSLPDNRAIQDSEYYQLNNQSAPVSFSLGENKNLLVKFSHDTELGNITSAQYTQAFNEDFALSGLVNGGENQYQAALSGALKLGSHDLLKGYAEYLNQSLSYSFYSGDTDVRTWQESYSLEYKHLLENAIVRDFGVEIDASHASSQSLSSVQYFDNDGNLQNNLRRVAGGNEQGAQVNSTFTLGSMTLLDTSVGYQKLSYDLDYSDDSTTYSATASAALKQQITRQFNINLNAATQAAYNSYGAGLEYHLRQSNLGLNASVTQLVAKDISTSNSTLYSVGGIWNIDSPVNDERSTDSHLSVFNAMTEAADINPALRVNTKVDQKVEAVQTPALVASLSGCSYDGATQTLTCAGQNLLQLGGASDIYRHYSGTSCGIPGIYTSTPNTFTNNSYVVSPVGLMGQTCNMSLCNNSACSDKETNSVFITGT